MQYQVRNNWRRERNWIPTFSRRIAKRFARLRAQLYAEAYEPRDVAQGSARPTGYNARTADLQISGERGTKVSYFRSPSVLGNGPSLIRILANHTPTLLRLNCDKKCVCLSVSLGRDSIELQRLLGEPDVRHDQLPCAATCRRSRHQKSQGINPPFPLRRWAELWQPRWTAQRLAGWSAPPSRLAIRWWSVSAPGRPQMWQMPIAGDHRSRELALGSRRIACLQRLPGAPLFIPFRAAGPERPRFPWHIR